MTPLGDLAHERGVGAVCAGGDRGDGDALLVDGLDDRLVVVGGRVAVAEQDDVLERRLALVELRRRDVQVLPVAGRVSELHGGDRRLDLRLVGELRQRHHEVAAHAVGDADEVAGRQLVDHRIRRAAEHLVPLARLRALEHEHHRHGRLLQVLGELDLHRKRGLERRPRVAAGTVAVVASDHHQADSEVARRGLEQRHAVHAKARRRDVDQHHRLVRGQVGRGSRHLRDRDRLESDAGGAQRRLQARRVAVHLLDEEDARRPDDLHERLAEVVLGVGVEHRVDRDPDAVESRDGRLDGLDERRLAVGEVDLRGAQQGAVEVPPHGRRGGRVAHDHGLGARLLALVDRPRRVEAVDAGLGPDRHAQNDGVDADAFGVQEPCLRDRVAQVRAAVADDDDVPSGVGRQDRARELQRRREVGVVGVGPDLELCELRVGAHVHLDLRVAAEAHHAGAVGALPLGEDGAHGGRLAVVGALRARGKVGQDHDRLLGWRGLELETGERACQEQDDDHAEAERHPRAPRRQRRGDPPPDEDDGCQGDDARSEEERAGQLKAHGGKPATRRGRG